MERALSVALEETLGIQKMFWIRNTHTPLYLNDHLFSLFSLALHDHTECLPGLRSEESLVLHHPPHATRADLMGSKFIDKMMHIDEENTQILDLLVTLCVRGGILTSPILWWWVQLTAGEAGLLMRMSSSSRKQMRIERFNFFSSAFRSVWKKTA